jgi:hypothetical protein
LATAIEAKERAPQGVISGDTSVFDGAVIAAPQDKAFVLANVEARGEELSFRATREVREKTRHGVHLSIIVRHRGSEIPAVLG